MLGGNAVSDSPTRHTNIPTQNPAGGHKSLQEQLLILAMVQELDLKIDQLNAQKNALPENLKALDLSLAQLQKNLVLKANELAEIQKSQRQTQAAVELNQDRMARATKKLEAVGNSQEFQAATKEIEQLKKLNLTFETQNAKHLSDTEANQKSTADLKAQLEKIQSERDVKAGELEGVCGKLDADLASLLTERKGFTQNIEITVVSRYDRIRAGRAGVGIAAAVAGRCTVCNLMVPPQMFNELKKTREAVNCPSCHRLLYTP